MTTPPPFSPAHAQLLHLLAEGPELEAFLTEAVRLAAESVPNADACGMTLSRDLRAFTAAHSDSLAAQIDELQYGAHEGPCLDALHTGRLIQVNDLEKEDRWPRYRPHAIKHGIAASLSYPLRVEGQTVAVLNLYACHPNAFTPLDRQHTEVLASQCSAAIAVMLRQADQASIQRQLADAMHARSIIDQALGILMAQQRCTAEQAFELLHAASSARNRKLRDIAADLIEKATGHPAQPPAPFTDQHNAES